MPISVFPSVLGLTTRLGAINLIQRGTIVINDDATSNTATITTVATARSVLSHLGATAAISNAVNEALSRLALTNATTITATRDVVSGVGTSTDLTIGYQVVEYAE